MRDHLMLLWRRLTDDAEMRRVPLGYDATCWLCRTFRRGPVVPVNYPRCEMKHGVQCRNQAAGIWTISGRAIHICSDDRDDLAEQGIDVADDGWLPLHPDPVRSATANRLQRMAAGYFG